MCFSLKPYTVGGKGWFPFISEKRRSVFVSTIVNTNKRQNGKPFTRNGISFTRTWRTNANSVDWNYLEHRL